jgi:PmbA protein
VEEILERAKRVAEEAEVYRVTSEETPVLFEANRLKQLQARQRTLIVLRIIKDGQIGLATTTRRDDPESLVNMAVEVSRGGVPARFQLPASRTYPQVEVFDPEVEKVPVEGMIELGESLIAKVRQHTAELLCEAEVTKGTAWVSILNSGGGGVSYQKSFFSLSLVGTLIRDTDMLFVGDQESSCHPLRSFDAIAETTLTQLESARRLASAPTKRLPVVFTPGGVASALIPPLALAFNGKTVVQGASPLGNRLGEKVFHPELLFWDDALIAYRPGSRPGDDEGVASQRTPLISQGVVASFLYDLQTAAMANTHSTGNGSRASGGTPTPSSTAFIIGEGDASFEEMVSDMKEGLVVEQLLGAGQGKLLVG